MMLEIQEKINKRYDQKRVLVEIVDQYKNMKEIIEKNMAPIELAKEAMKIIGITPIIEPIRGGTDGATISFLGIPTPNLFAGGENFHGPYEFISVRSMEAAIQAINEIIVLNAK
jgi:tripeptide aminopeptidase